MYDNLPNKEDEAVPAEDTFDEEWTEMQEMLSVALDQVEDELFEISGAERTHEAMEEMQERIGSLALNCFVHKIPGKRIPVERDAITACFFAVGLTRRMIEKWEKPQEAAHCLCAAAKGLGWLEMQKLMPTIAAMKAADARHEEDREKAEAIKAWYRENGDKYNSMAKAAEEAHIIFNVAYTTARGHIGEENKKLRSARKV